MQLWKSSKGISMIKLAIIGCGGHGKVVADIAEKLGYDVSFFDDDLEKQKKNTVLGNFKSLLSNNDFENCFVAIGDNKIRSEHLYKLKEASKKMLSLIDPSAIIAKDVLIGDGSVIMPNVSINSGAQIGEGAIVNTSAVIEHDCLIGDYAHICPGAVIAGNVKIGDASQVGINASLIPGLIIGDNVSIGAGSVILQNVSPNSVVYGNPGKAK